MHTINTTILVRLRPSRSSIPQLIFRNSNTEHLSQVVVYTGVLHFLRPPSAFVPRGLQ